MAASDGDTTPYPRRSRLNVSLRPLNGVSKENGLLRDLPHLDTLSTGISICLAICSAVARAELLDQLAAGADQLIDRLDHVHRDADGAGLIGDGAGDSLADPPSGIGGEFVAATPFKLVGTPSLGRCCLLIRSRNCKPRLLYFWQWGH